jgi:hypothetical protein
VMNGAVRPKAEAAPQPYDPWERFGALQGQYRTAETLWGEFVETMRQIEAEVVGYAPSAKGESLIVEWSNKYGLLGVLPAQAQLIVLPPTYERAEQYFSGFPRRISNRAIIQRRYARVAGSWMVHFEPHVDLEAAVTVDEEAAVTKDSDWMPGTEVPEAKWSALDMEPPRTLLWEWEDLNWKSDERNQRISKFFIDSRWTNQYPPPLSEEFWKKYQEPLWAWVRAARVFCKAVEFVSQVATARHSGEPAPAQLEHNARKGLWVLNSLANSESHYYEFGASALNQSWSSASLLSAMAEMFFLDILAGRRALRCSTCQRIFVSNDPRARYCSRKCRNTAQTRRYRSKLAVGKDTSARG